MVVFIVVVFVVVVLNCVKIIAPTPKFKYRVFYHKSAIFTISKLNIPDKPLGILLVLNLKNTHTQMDITTYRLNGKEDR